MKPSPPKPRDDAPVEKPTEQAKLTAGEEKAAPACDARDKATAARADKPGSAAIFDRIKELSGLSALLYAFGFLVLRARLNVLGVTAALPIADERYLLAGGTFLAETLAALFPLGFLGLAIAAVAYLVSRASSRRAARGRDAVLALLKDAPWLLTTVQIGLALALSKVVEVQFSRVVIAAHSLGAPVSGSWILDELRAHGHQRADLYTILILIVVATATLLHLYRGVPPKLPEAPRPLRWYVAFMLVFEVLALPINYAVLEWDPRYPVVTTRPAATAAPIPGLEERAFLLLQTDKEIVLYTQGKVITVERATISSLTVHCLANVFQNEACPPGEPNVRPELSKAAASISAPDAAAARDGGSTAGTTE